MYYCFNFLPQIADPEFSFHYALGHTELASELAEQRKKRLLQVSNRFIQIYRPTFNVI